VRGQQPAIPAVGYLSSGTSAGFAHFVDAFREGLSETGYVEGRNVTFQFRWAEGHEDRLPALAGDLVARQVAVTAVTGGLHPAVVAKGRNLDYSDCIYGRRRSGETRSRRQPRSPGCECDRRDQLLPRGDCEATGAIPAVASHREHDRRA